MTIEIFKKLQKSTVTVPHKCFSDGDTIKVLLHWLKQKCAKENYDVLKDVKLDKEDLELLNKPNLKEITSNWSFDPTEFVDPVE